MDISLRTKQLNSLFSYDKKTELVVGHRTESGGGKSLLELVDLAGATGLGEAKRDDLQMAHIPIFLPLFWNKCNHFPRRNSPLYKRFHP